MSINQAVVVGRVGRDPEVRTTQSGQTVANFSVATSRRWRDKSGELQEETEWHRIVAWGRPAEIAGQYVQKGDLIGIEGRLQTRKWQDRNSGDDRYTTEIICHPAGLRLLTSKKDREQQNQGQRRDDRQYAERSDPPEDDDIPF